MTENAALTNLIFYQTLIFMKNLSIALLKQLLIIKARTDVYFTRKPWRILSWALALFLTSCNLNPNLEDVTVTKNDLTIRDLPVLAPLPLVSTFVLDKVDLYLTKGSAMTGTATVEIRNGDGSVILATATVSAASLATGSAWNTFHLSHSISVTPGIKYRIYLTRSDDHNYAAGNYMFWRTSSGGVDAYPNGINDVSPGWTLDYAFRTYSSGTLDQQQTSTNYAFFTSNNIYRWQEFVPEVPKVNLTYVDLNLDVGSATTGTLTVQIRNADGTTVLSQAVISASSLLPGNNWKKFKVGATLNRNEKYRIYVIRSDAHNYFLNNYIFWRTSSGGVDAYPGGVNDVYPSWTLDYAFRTYSAISGLDQHQDLTTYGFALGNSAYRWQEFIPWNQ